jgi:hypothetical protein
MSFSYASYTTSSAIASTVDLAGIRATAPIVITLPTVGTGKVITIKDESGNAQTYGINIVPASGTIDGQSNYQMSANYESLSLYSNGTNWFII